MTPAELKELARELPLTSGEASVGPGSLGAEAQPPQNQTGPDRSASAPAADVLTPDETDHSVRDSQPFSPAAGDTGDRT